MKRFYSLVVIFCFPILSFGQNEVNAVFLDNAPQTLYINPARPMEHKVWIGLPVISKMHFSATSTGISIQDVLGKDVPLNDVLDNITTGAEQGDYFQFYERIDLFNLGFPIGKGFFLFNVNQGTVYNMEYPVNLFDFAINGNAQYLNQTVDIGDFSINGQSLLDFGLTYQFPIGSKLTVGLTGHYVKGLVDLRTEKTNIVTTTSQFETLINTDFLARSSYIVDPTNEDLNIDPQSALNSPNQGYYGDIGLHYVLNNHFSFGAAVSGMGQINWEENVTTYVGDDNDIVWKGFNYEYGQDNDVEFSDYLSTLLDSLQIEEVPGGSYTTNPFQRYLVTAEYNLDSTHAFGIAYSGVNLGNTFQNKIGINYIGRYSKWFHLLVGYSIIRENYQNIALGFTLNLGPVQLMLMSDNVLDVIRFPKSYNSSLRFGLNLCFGERDRHPVKPTVKQD